MDTTKQLHFHFSLLCIGEGNGHPFQRSCLENPMDGGAWLATVHGVAKSQTQLSDFTILSIRVLTARAAAAGPSSLSLLCPVDSPPPSPPQGFSKTARYLHFWTTHPKPWKWRGRLGPERRAPSWQDSKLCLLRSLRLMSPPSSRPLQLPNPQPRPHRPRTRRGDNRKALPAP